MDTPNSKAAAPCWEGPPEEPRLLGKHHWWFMVGIFPLFMKSEWHDDTYQNIWCPIDGILLLKSGEKLIEHHAT